MVVNRESSYCEWRVFDGKNGACLCLEHPCTLQCHMPHYFVYEYESMDICFLLHIITKRFYSMCSYSYKQMHRTHQKMGGQPLSP